LGIFIEAVPYLLLGTLASGLVEVFFDRELLLRLILRQKALAALSGGLLGLFFPVCECGVVPLTRRLIRKGMPVHMGIAFLLAAPVLNPIVIASTLAAFGPGLVFWGRLALSLVVAVATGLVFSAAGNPDDLLRHTVNPNDEEGDTESEPPAKGLAGQGRLQRVAGIAVDEFFEMGTFLVLGAMLAALLQTVVPQSSLTGISQGNLSSVLVMLALAVLLSVCSTVDAFIALAFANTFSVGSVLAFLVFGPMVDIKSTLMFLRVFKKRTVLFLVLLPLMMVLAATVGINVWMGR
jgi:uncharacterized membrane protein YraQ (UPF0718 family)